MVDIHQEGHSQRSAPKKRHIAHQRQAWPLPHSKPSSWDRRGDKIHSPSGETTTSTWSPELLEPGKGTKHKPNWVHAFVEYSRTLPEQLRPGKCTQPRARFRQWTNRSNIDPEKCKLGKCTHPELGQTQCGRVFEHFPCQWYFFIVFLPPHSMAEQVSLNSDRFCPAVSGWKLDTEETSK